VERKIIMKDNIKELEEKILKDAREEADTLVSRAKKAKERILQQAWKEEKEIKEEAKREGESLFEKEKVRVSAKKEIDKKKGLFTLRKKIFKKLHEDLSERLISMLKDGELNDWIKSSCNEVIKKEKEVVLVSAEENLNHLKKICKGMKGLKFKSESMTDGFLLRGEKEEYDFRFSLLAENIVKKNISMVVDKLEGNDG
jgi:vacuolar-type H+-ATPase subunit E/Vma4